MSKPTRPFLVHPLARRAASAPGKRRAIYVAAALCVLWNTGAVYATSEAVSPSPTAQSAQDPAPAKADGWVETANHALGFVDLSDGQTIAARTTHLIVKGPLGRDFALTVNGQAVPSTQVGRRGKVASKNLQFWEYFGVPLQPGLNQLELSQGDAPAQHLSVRTPGKATQITLTPQSSNKVADGKTPIAVDIQITDSSGLTVIDPIEITPATNSGHWDLRGMTPGSRSGAVVLSSGHATLPFVPPSEPGPVDLRVSADTLQGQASMTLGAELRPMLAVGVVEGIINLKQGMIHSAGAGDGFEQELRALSHEWNGGKDSIAGRSAFFLKGKVRGDYLLTAAFDSEKEVKDRLFRDIQPDKYYPIYGDASVRGFDAQSSGKAYLRVDKGQSYLVYGDFIPNTDRQVRQLSRYNRALTGVKEHYESDRVSADVFASRDNTSQRVAQIPLSGISGPFRVFAGEFVENSERVEIITEDRNLPTLEWKTQVLTRFVDYYIDDASHALHLRAPEPGLDQQGNRRILRVTYETPGSGNQFWVVGGSAEVQVINGLKLGAVVVQDENHDDGRSLRAVTLDAVAPGNITIDGEAVQTDSVKHGTGFGGRLGVKGQLGETKFSATGVTTNDTFDNLSSPVSPGRTEVRARIEQPINATTLATGEAINLTENNRFSNEHHSVHGASVNVVKQLPNNVKLELGGRVARGEQQINGTSQDIDLNTVRAKVSAPIPGLPSLSMYGEAEQDVLNGAAHQFALGGEYHLNSNTRLYGRQELVSSLGSLYELGSQQRSYRTQFGIEHNYSTNGHVFSEYRQGGMIDGRDAQAAYGIRQGWEIAPGLTANGSFERQQNLGGKTDQQSTALTGSLEYLANSRWKANTSLELRRSTSEDSVLFTMGGAYKVNADMSVLGKSISYLSWGKNGATDGTRMRQRLGLAYRPASNNNLNALAYYEHRLESGSLAPEGSGRRQSEILAANVGVNVTRNLAWTVRQAFKHTTITNGDVHDTITGSLTSTRVTWDVTNKWDVGAMLAYQADTTGAHGLAYGIETGYVVAKNAWLSVGYNIQGVKDRDLSGEEQIAKGPYLRFRYKFDEATF